MLHLARGLAIVATLAAATGMARAAPLSPAAQLGKVLFTDTSLSASGRMSCASCHDPANHYAPNNDLAVQLGGPKLDQPGVRAVPSLTYLSEIPAFDTQLTNPDGTQSAPGGGFDWDGREPTLAAQAGVPLLSPFEMANPDMAAVVAKIASRPERIAQLKAAFGEAVFNDTQTAFKAIGIALEAYQLEDPAFHPYSSKYDAYIAGRASLTAQEQRGMAIFNDADRANCAACHTAGQGPGRINGLSSGQFTDFFFRNIGAPNNPRLHGAADEGLCGPLRQDLSVAKSPANAAYCGMFMTPTLRNAATRHVFMHDGSLHSLREVINFYLTRDTTPRRWYAASRYGRLPPRVRVTVDRDDMPFASQHLGSRPILSNSEVDDLIVFLATLTDGYKPEICPYARPVVTR